ncbi:NAC domain-containing protein 45 [Populus alba x Populus x berolinensis]|uniref:NAC domain-containing protein 45 n=1 Tax=Populus alba x Populus x berolinensis TaxID=444605 RepID=A0AAD6W6B7_9ROSI|nr:NAC domain-containing protein 45 [Populus alba x Populus x berolinensis]
MENIFVQENQLLPSKDLEWYFFLSSRRKYPNGSRTNRATQAGYWKATGKDRKVISQMRAVGMKKTLVYYRGRAPHGARTGWVMHEYRLDERECEINTGLQDAYALCRVSKRTANIPKLESIMILRQIKCLILAQPDYRAIGSPLNIGESRNGKWIQSMDGSFGMSAPQFPNYSTVPYPPSKS